MVSIISYILAPFLVQTSMSSLSCCVFCHMTAWQDCLTAMQLHELTCLWNVAQERQLHLPTGTTLTCPWADTWALQTTYKCVHIDTLSCTYAHIPIYTHLSTACTYLSTACTCSQRAQHAHGLCPCTCALKSTCTLICPQTFTHTKLYIQA